MATADFFDASAKAAVKASIEKVERQTSAELVVTVRKRAADYREADYLAGAVLGFAALAFAIYSPMEFATTWIPVDVAVAFAIGAGVSSVIATVRRLLVPKARLVENVRKAARSAFLDLGISRTTGRNGILVLVSAFERKAAVVADIAVDPTWLADITPKIEAAIDRGRGPDLEAFIVAIEAIGPALAKEMPRQDDDVNELPDEVGSE